MESLSNEITTKKLKEYKMKKFLIVLFVVCWFVEASATSAWLTHSSPWGVWKQGCGKVFPVKLMLKDLSEMGVDELFFFDQLSRGGPFAHNTKVKHAKRDSHMGKRDFLEELLKEADKYGMKVWVCWTTPAGKYPGTEFYGLNDPGILRIYREVTEEIARNYGKHKSLQGFFWHETNGSEGHNYHENDIGDFSNFCKKKFGEKYVKDKMPKVDPNDKWWRRFFLYKINVMNQLVITSKKVADKYGLKTAFCYYLAVGSNAQAWRWGYDVVSLEKLCDRMWFTGYSTEFSKHYQSVKGGWYDFGPSYRSQILPRNYSYAFHGKPISFFESRTPVYLDMVRKYYNKKKGFSQRYSDFYTGYLEQTTKSQSLFYGKENLTKWIRMMSYWKGGVSVANISEALNPRSFIMQYPLKTGNEVIKRSRYMLLALTKQQDVDGFILGCEFSLKVENLLKYSVISILEDMGIGLSQKTVKVLKEYVQKGGKLLLIASPLVESKEDLTEKKDLTKLFAGLQISPAKDFKRRRIMPIASGIPLKFKQFRASGIKEVKLKGAKVLVKCGKTGKPLLTEYNNVYFTPVKYNAQSANFFCQVIKLLSKPAIMLKGSNGIRILETVKKDNALCIPLWEKGKASLVIDVKRVGLSGDKFMVREILTGKILAKIATPEQLKRGIPVEIKYENQPFIVAVGSPTKIAEFKGIYPNEDVFKGLAQRVMTENPEVPIIVPKKPGIKVGVYHNGFGTSKIVSALNKCKDINSFSIPRLGPEVFSAVDVIIIPQSYLTLFINNAGVSLRKWVKAGGRVIFLHNAVGFKAHAPLFARIVGKGENTVGKPMRDKTINTVEVVMKHPVTAGFNVGDKITYAYTDHIALKLGLRGKVVVKDYAGNAVVVVANYGRGKVVLNGMMSGWASIGKSAYDGKAEEPSGGELKLLENSVKWSVAKRRKKK